LPARQIVGITGIVATSRFEGAFVDVGDLDRTTISGFMVAGSEYDPVPLVSQGRVGDAPLRGTLSDHEIEDAIGWARVADPLSGTREPAQAIAEVVDAILDSRRMLLPLAVCPSDYQGTDPNVFVVVPATIDRGGAVPHVLDLPLEEIKQIQNASKNVAEAVKRHKI
jgi:malate/lactate dehydrogenase